MKKQLLLIGLLLVAVCGFSAIIDVPADQPTIQAGLNVAAEGDTVLVQPGIYYENLVWPATGSLKLYGTSTEECIIDGGNTDCVIYMLGISGETFISDFTIQNGNATGNDQPADGGGIFCSTSTLYLSNLIITNNTAIESGGGIYSNTAELNLDNITIINNCSNIDAWRDGGGGAHFFDSNVNLNNIHFENNTAVSSGGGLFSFSSELNILNSEFTDNHSYYDPGFSNQFGGGGMFCYSGSSYVEDVTFSDNSASSNGGGFGLNLSDAEMINVYVTNNSAQENGGGIYLQQSSPEFTNFLITNNLSENSGGGLFISATMGDYPLLTNVTISDNSSLMGGGIGTMLGGPRITNSIVWNNGPEEIYGIDHVNGLPAITITNSDIEGGEAGINFENGTISWLEGNLESEPQFINSGDHPYSLSNDSPCIDAGTLTLVQGYQLPEFDILGNQRIYGDMVDMGAYEWQGTGKGDELEVLSPKLSNYPNPFNPSTTIQFETTNLHEIAQIEIYNLKGQKVKTLPVSPSQSYKVSVTWNGTDKNSQPVSSGVYFYKLKVGNETKAVQKCLLLK